MLIAPKEVILLSFSAITVNTQWKSCSVVLDWIGICLNLGKKLKAGKMQAYVNKKGTLIKAEGNKVHLKNIGDSSTNAAGKVLAYLQTQSTITERQSKSAEKRGQVNPKLAHMADG